jgi:hypothetical protein
LSARFQHLLKENESLELQFSLSLPRFPIGHINESASFAPERSGDLLNPRNRTKCWIDLSLRRSPASCGVREKISFLIGDMVIEKFSSTPRALSELAVGTRVRAYLSRDRLQELGIDFEESNEKYLRVYDYLLIPSPTTDSVSLNSPFPLLLCTQLCELVPK